jgi:hypothetical protein
MRFLAKVKEAPTPILGGWGTGVDVKRLWLLKRAGRSCALVVTCLSTFNDIASLGEKKGMLRTVSGVRSKLRKPHPFHGRAATFWVQ